MPVDYTKPGASRPQPATPPAPTEKEKSDWYSGTERGQRGIPPVSSGGSSFILPANATAADVAAVPTGNTQTGWRYGYPMPASWRGLSPYEQVASGQGPIGLGFQRVGITAQYNNAGLELAISEYQRTQNAEAYKSAYREESNKALENLSTEKKTELYQQSAIADLSQEGLISIERRTRTEKEQEEYRSYMKEKGKYATEEDIKYEPYIRLTEKGQALGLENLYGLEEGAIWGKAFDFVPSSSRGNVLIMVPQGTRATMKELGIDQPFALEKGGDQYLISGSGGTGSITVQKIDPFSYSLGEKQQMPLSDFVEIPSNYELTPSTQYSYSLSDKGIDVSVSGLKSSSNPYQLNYAGIGLGMESQEPQETYDFSGTTAPERRFEAEVLTNRMIQQTNVVFQLLGRAGFPGAYDENGNLLQWEQITSHPVYLTDDFMKLKTNTMIQNANVAFQIAGIPKQINQVGGEGWTKTYIPSIPLIGGFLGDEGQYVEMTPYAVVMEHSYAYEYATKAADIIPKVPPFNFAGFIPSDNPLRAVSNPVSAAVLVVGGSFETIAKDIIGIGYVGSGIVKYNIAPQIVPRAQYEFGKLNYAFGVATGTIQPSEFALSYENNYFGLNIGQYPRYSSPSYEELSAGIPEQERREFPSNFIASKSAITLGPILDIPLAIGQVGELALSVKGGGSAAYKGAGMENPDKGLHYGKVQMFMEDDGTIVRKTGLGTYEYIWKPTAPVPKVIGTSSFTEVAEGVLEEGVVRLKYADKLTDYYSALISMKAEPVMQYITPVINTAARINYAGWTEAWKFVGVQFAFETGVPFVAGMASAGPNENVFVKGYEASVKNIQTSDAWLRMGFAGVGGYMAGAALEGINLAYPAVKETGIGMKQYAQNKVVQPFYAANQVMSTDFGFEAWRFQHDYFGRTTFRGYNRAASERAAAEIFATKEMARMAELNQATAVRNRYLSYSPGYSSVSELKRNKKELEQGVTVYLQPISGEEYGYETQVYPEKFSTNLRLQDSFRTSLRESQSLRQRQTLRTGQTLAIRHEFDLGLRQQTEQKLAIRQNIRQEIRLDEALRTRENLRQNIRLGLRLGLRQKIPEVPHSPPVKVGFDLGRQMKSGKRAKVKLLDVRGYNPSVAGVDLGLTVKKAKKAYSGLEIRGLLSGKRRKDIELL